MRLTPQPGAQTEFLRRQEDEVLYGGAKGGGKSYALLLESLRQVSKPEYRALIVRRTFPRLQELIDRSKQIFPRLGASYTSQDHKWTFPSGAIIRFGHCQNKGDEQNYQGHEYAFIGFDQLEEFLESQYIFISAQNRSSVAGIKCYIRATANPGSIGHAWVKKRFIDKREPYKTYNINFTLPDGNSVSRSTCFIPATVYDNKILLANNPNYIATLYNLPERERKAMLEGNWDVFAGQFFNEFDENTHVIPRFEIPEDWMRFNCGDYGFTAPSAIYSIAVEPETEDLFVYREIYKTGLTYSALAQEINRQCEKEPISYTVFDPAIWAKHGTTGETGAEIMINNNLFIQKGDNDRFNGWAKLREYLRDPSGKPHMFIFEECEHLIRTLPSLVHDKYKVEDVDSDGEDHAADSIRYGVMSRPRAKVIHVNEFKNMTSSQAFMKMVEDNEKVLMEQDSPYLAYTNQGIKIENYSKNTTVPDPDYY